MQLSTGLIYLTLGTAFIISGVQLITCIKTHYQNMYSSLKAPLWTATILLSVTAWVRAALDIIRYIDKSGLGKAIYESEVNNTWFAPAYDSFLFIFSDLLPISAQLFSLIFGIIRQRRLTGEMPEAI